MNLQESNQSSDPSKKNKHLIESSNKNKDGPSSKNYQEILYQRSQQCARSFQIYAQQQAQASLLRRAAQSLDKFGTCIAAYASSLVSFLSDTSNLLLLAHRHYKSQAHLLAASLSNHAPDHPPISILTSDLYLRSWVDIIDPSIQDRHSALLNQLQKEKIKVSKWSFLWKEGHPLNLESILPSPEYRLLILDIHLMSPCQYKPELYAVLGGVKDFGVKTVIYYHPMQEEALGKMLKEIGIPKQIPLTLIPEHPISYEIEPNRAKAEDILIKFLREERLQPKKRDVIIFTITTSNYCPKLYYTELFRKNKLSSSVTLVTQHLEVLPNHLNKIFLPTSTMELLKWNYDYSQVFLILDFGIQANFLFNYEIMSYIDDLSVCSRQELLKRMSFAASQSLAKYIAVFPPEILARTAEINYLDQEPDLAHYCLRMLYRGFQSLLQSDHPRIIACLQSLNLFQIIPASLQPTSSLPLSQILTLSWLNPVYIQLIHNHLLHPRLANLLTIGLCTMAYRGELNIVNSANKKVRSKAKPTGVWRKSGDLHSALEIVTKLEMIEQRQAEIPLSKKKSILLKRNTSKKSSEGRLGDGFEIAALKKLQFDEMNEDDFIKEFSINYENLNELRNLIDSVRDLFRIEPDALSLTQADVYEVMQLICKANGGRSLAYDSGSRRQGYRSYFKSKGLILDHKSLTAQLTDKPSGLFFVRVSINRIDQRKAEWKITMSNLISADLLHQAQFQFLGLGRKLSSCDNETEFTEISSATFQELREHEEEISHFQEQHGSIVESHEDRSVIMLYSSVKKSTEVTETFNLLLSRIKNKLQGWTKQYHYLANTNLILGGGGTIVEIMKNSVMKKCEIQNLQPDCTREELYELFEEFFTLKNITLFKDETPGKKSAIVEFNSQRDYHRFIEYYDNCLYMDRIIRVRGIESSGAQKSEETAYLKAKWTAWRSRCEGVLEFENSEEAINQLRDFGEDRTIDGKKIEVVLDGNKLWLRQLSPYTDEYVLEEIFKTAKRTEIFKIPSKETGFEEERLIFSIKECVRNETKNEARCWLKGIKKMKNGLREAKIFFSRKEDLMCALGQLNKQVGKIGMGKLHLESWFSYPIYAPEGYLILYETLVADTIQELKIEGYLQIVKQKNEGVFLLVKHQREEALNIFIQEFMKKLVGYEFEIQGQQVAIVISDIGLSNILDLEQKYLCRINSNPFQRTLRILCRSSDLKSIQEDIRQCISENFFYRMNLNKHLYRYLQENPEKYESIKPKYHLSYVYLEEINNCLVLEGNAKNIYEAMEYLRQLSNQEAKPSEGGQDGNICGICYCDLIRPYRLHACGHRFCLDCLIQHLEAILRDFSLFPIRCPHCMQEIVSADLEMLGTKDTWPKIVNMAINDFISKNGANYGFCYNAGCKQICIKFSNQLKCDLCYQIFCDRCKRNSHPGLTCDQARLGLDKLFQAFMIENKIRKCANKSCRFPIERISGCFKVACSRCNKCMCFKCPPQSMKAYNNASQCYTHLTEVHGGYY